MSPRLQRFASILELQGSWFQVSVWSNIFIFLQNVIVDLFDIVRLVFFYMQIGILKISKNRKLENVTLSLSFNNFSMLFEISPGEDYFTSEYSQIPRCLIDK